MMLALHGQVLEGGAAVLSGGMLYFGHCSFQLQCFFLYFYAAGSNAEEKTTVFSYWLRMLLALPEWYKLVNCHAILDYIFMHARSIGGNVLLECR